MTEDKFYKKEDGSPDFTREVQTGLPPGTNLHEAALQRPHEVEKIISEGGASARADAAEKMAADTERATSTIIPDETKTQEILEDLDPAAITETTDQIQPNTDINPAAHAADAQTGEETLTDASAKASSDAAKAKSETPAGELPLKVEVVDKEKEQAAAAKAKADADKKVEADKKKAEATKKK